MENIKFIWVYLCSLGLVLLTMPAYISFLKKLKIKQTVSEYMPSEAVKNGTPTMGGVLFVLVPLIVIAITAFSSFSEPKFRLVILAFIGYGLIGFSDDYLIVVRHNNKGLPARVKFLLQIVLAIIFYMIYQSNISTDVLIPFTDITIPFGIFYIGLVVLLFASSSNAVNLTDGMDGLAAGTSVIALIPLLFLALRQQENAIALFIMALLGALFGYLFFNYHPAKVFMGDAGSLALGGLIAALGLVLKCELSVIIVGGVFVLDTLSVILQIASVKIRHKRIFKCSPIHYHFKMCGMKETQVVWMFYIAGIIFAILGYLSF